MGYHGDGIGIYRPDTNVKSTLGVLPRHSFHGAIRKHEPV